MVIGLEFSGGLMEPITVAGSENDVEAVAGKLRCDRTANALRCASNENGGSHFGDKQMSINLL